MMEKQIKAKNITWHCSAVSGADRQAILGHAGCVVWLTGLSGSGKSTIALLLEEQLMHNGHLAYVLDGDNIRHGLNRDLGFTATDRQENIRRIGEVAALFARAGVISISSFISPYISGRQSARQAVDGNMFIEVFLNIPLSECEKRDPKGLYRKARAGEIADFTGIDAPYEPPENAELVLETHKLSPAQSVEIILTYLKSNGIIQDRNMKVK